MARSPNRVPMWNHRVGACLPGSQEHAMFNRNRRKTNQRISAVIVIILVIAMLISTVSYLTY